MSQRRYGTRLLVAAIATLLTGSLAGAPELVLCLGADGHRAIELEHDGTECPAIARTQGATGVSVWAPTECFDIPAAGSGPTTPSSFEAGRGLTPPVALLAVCLEAPRRSRESLPAPTGARTARPNLALHLNSTVLLV